MQSSTQSHIGQQIMSLCVCEWVGCMRGCFVTVCHWIALFSCFEPYVIRYFNFDKEPYYGIFRCVWLFLNNIHVLRIILGELRVQTDTRNFNLYYICLNGDFHSFSCVTFRKECKWLNVTTTKTTTKTTIAATITTATATNSNPCMSLENPYN